MMINPPNPDNKAVLLTDIASMLRPTHIYGYQYEAVNVLSDFTGVLIVEGNKGAFPVASDRVRLLDSIGLEELKGALDTKARLLSGKKTALSLAGITLAEKKIYRILYK